MLVKYIKNNRGVLVGTVVAIGPNEVGLALCSPKDRFNKEMGKRVALGRAKLAKSGDFERAVPHLPNRKDLDSTQIVREYDEMVDRSVRYFKQESMV